VHKRRVRMSRGVMVGNLVVDRVLGL
jgi:hypothetical protein